MDPIPRHTPSQGSPILQHTAPLPLRLPPTYIYLEQTQGPSSRRVLQIIRLYITPNYTPQEATHHPPTSDRVQQEQSTLRRAPPKPAHLHPPTIQHRSQTANAARRRHTTVDPIRAPAHASPTRTSQPPIYVPASPQGQQTAGCPPSETGTMHTKTPSTPAKRQPHCLPAIYSTRQRTRAARRIPPNRIQTTCPHPTRHPTPHLQSNVPSSLSTTSEGTPHASRRPHHHPAYLRHDRAFILF